MPKTNKNYEIQEKSDFLFLIFSVRKPEPDIIKIILCTMVCLVHLSMYPQNPVKKFDFNRKGQRYQSFNFRLINNLIILPVIINDSDTLNFILDTGISNTLITELTSCDSFTLNFSREIELNGLGAGEPVKAIYSYGNEVKIKSITGHNQDILVIADNNFRLSSRMGIPVHGILGYPVFRDFVVKINYDTRTISFYNPQAYRAKRIEHRCRCIPLEIINSKAYINLIIRDMQGNSFPVKLLADIGASHAIWLDINSLDSLTLPEGSKESYLGTGLNGEMFGYTGRIKSLEAGDFILNDVIVSFPDSASMGIAAGLDQRNGSMGSEIFRRFNLVIDYTSGRICLKPNNEFKSDYAQNLSGMEVIAPYPGIRIFVADGVRQDSPAGRAGMRKGDLIMKINGKNASDLELNDIYQILQHHPGKKISIMYMRENEIIETGFVLEKYI